MFKVAVRAPGAVGLNVISIEHVPVPAGIPVPPVQLSLPITKSPEFVPLIVGVLVIVIAAPVKLLSVTVCGALCVLTSCPVANVSGFGLTKTTGFAPVPLSVTACALNPMPVIVSVAVRGLVIAVGEKVMLTMQVPVSAGTFAPAVQVVPAATA